MFSEGNNGEPFIDHSLVIKSSLRFSLWKCGQSITAEEVSHLVGGKRKVSSPEQIQQILYYLAELEISRVEFNIHEEEQLLDDLPLKKSKKKKRQDR